MTRVLVVEDDAVARDLLLEVLRGDGHEVAGEATAEAALEAITRHRPDVVITDVRLEGMDGVELMQRVLAENPRIKFIVVTAFGSFDTAVRAIQSGAFDYMSKPFSMDEVTAIVRRASGARHAAGDASIEDGEAQQTIVGRSAAMTRLFKSIARVAASSATVLIQGETGTGKELVARAIHDAGPRAKGPYVAINCPSLPEGLLESELFGHVKGAFTGATSDRVGLFETASGGTLLLDEIGDMPLGVQAKLLRVLETSEIRRVGSSTVARVDVRVIAATHRDLQREVIEGRFREDLLYRLNAVTLRVPPLRDRSDDIPLLVSHFLRRDRTSGTQPAPSRAFMAALVRYPWPGNVRELAHVLERAVALSDGSRLDLHDLPSVVRDRVERTVDLGTKKAQTLDEVERAHILSVLESVGGARSRAAEILGIDRKTLYRKLQRYGIDAEGE